MSFNSIERIINICESQKIEFYQAIINDDCKERGVSPMDSYEQMKQMWEAMLLASNEYDAKLTSKSGLVGGDGAKMHDYVAGNSSYCGTFVTEVMEEALKMGESNACMKRIVAAPTAGSCGVIPAVLIPYYKSQISTESSPENLSDTILNALYVAAGVGQVIAQRAYIAGAAGGCQAEIGSASAMAAAALVYMKGGSNEQICQSAAMALKNLLGLVCDPVAGLVEVPCVKRNVIGAVNALSCADMALAGIKSAIPVDQIIDAMREIGGNMNSKYKETADGGCAATPAAINIQNKIQLLNV